MNINTGGIMITISSVLTTCGLAKLRLLDNLYLPLSSPPGDLKIFSGTKGAKVIMLHGKRYNFGLF